ncbi:Uncharacterized protein Rs2_23300 [Raphanus sativus]|nr:Uncharacterized protein Rs2_23300 [Raphanus sativus]
MTSGQTNASKQKTTSTNIPTDPVNSTTTCISSFPEEKVNRSKELIASDPSSPQATSGLQVTQMNNIGFEAADTLDEERAKFLRLLGWDETIALTEEGDQSFL